MNNAKSKRSFLTLSHNFLYGISHNRSQGGTSRNFYLSNPTLTLPNVKSLKSLVRAEGSRKLLEREREKAVKPIHHGEENFFLPRTEQYPRPKVLWLPTAS